jgi:hypothetical protein
MFGARLVIKDSQSLNPMHISVNPFAIVSLSPHRAQGLDGLLAQELERCRLVAVYGDDGEGFILERSERMRDLVNLQSFISSPQYKHATSSLAPPLSFKCVSR